MADNGPPPGFNLDPDDLSRDMPQLSGPIAGTAQALSDTPAKGDEIEPTQSPIDFIAAGAGSALGSDMARAAPDIIGNEIGAIRFTSTGKPLGTVSKEALEAGEDAVKREIQDQASAAQPPSEPPVRTQNDIIESIKARYGDKISDKKWDKIEKYALASNEPYLPIYKSGNSISHIPGKDSQITGFYPNFNAKPTGSIGSLSKIESNIGDYNRMYAEEPLNWLDSKYGAGKSLIQAHSKSELPAEISTVSDLIAHDDYVNSLPQGSKVNLVMTQSPGDGGIDRTAPNMPSNKRMMTAYKKLKDSGVDAYLHYANPETKKIEPVNPFALKAIMDEKSPIGYAKGGLVKGYAEGGAILPAGFSLDSSETGNDSSSLPDGFQLDDEKYGTPSQLAATALEQGVSGATLGLSKKLETTSGFTTPEAIAGRERTNPLTAFGSNVLGTGAMLTATGGLGPLAEGAGLAGRIGIGAAEGAGIGGVNQATDDWSQNKPLDAQKILASAGIGFALGGLGSGIVEGISYLRGKPPVSPEATQAAENSANDVPPPGGGGPDGQPPSDQNLNGNVVDPPGYKGIKPTDYNEIITRANNAKYSGSAINLPQKDVLEEALSRVEMDNPVHPLQADSLANQGSRDLYNVAKETPGEFGNALNANESIQKNELVHKTDKAISDISLGSEPISDAVQGGRTAIEAFSDQYQNEKAALEPIFKDLKTSAIKGDPAVDAIGKMVDAVPGIAEMFDNTGADITIKPYKTAWGIDKATYNAVKEATNSLLDNPADFKSIWNIRKGLDQHIDVMAQGQAPNEIRSLKKALMDYMQEAVQGNPDVNVRDTFRRYAINEQSRNVIEKAFGASVGTPEFGAFSKIKPENIGDRIFANTANVEAAKQILPKEQFNTILANWIAEAKAAATDKGAFSSNKFGSFLRRNQDALNSAFQGSPEKLQRLKDLTTIMRILPDAPSMNPSGTAKTLFRMLQNTNVHDMTWEGLLASIPKKVVEQIGKVAQRSELNQALAGKATQNAAQQTLIRHASKTSDRIDMAIKALFRGASSQSRRINGR